MLALAGGSLALLQPGLREARLTAVGREVFSAVAQALLAGTLPANGAQREQALAGLLERIDALIAALPHHAQQELSQLLCLLAMAPGRIALAGLQRPWTTAGLREIQDSLRMMQLSALSLRQQAYQALHDIVGGAYFSHPSTWSVLGYPGPVAS